MLFKEKNIQLKNQKEALLRSPMMTDKKEMLDYLKTCAFETHFLLRYGEECCETPEQEACFIKSINDSEYELMILCIVDGEIAGNSHISFQRWQKTKHRASLSIAIQKKYWSLGIGTALMKEMISIAKEKHIRQLELEFIEGNKRAQSLYEKMGFQIVATKPDAYRLKDGTLLKEYMMIKYLDLCDE